MCSLVIIVDYIALFTIYIVMKPVDLMFLPQKEMVIMWSDGGVSYWYGGNHFVIYKCIISTYTYFNLHAISQLYLNKAGKTKQNKT